MSKKTGITRRTFSASALAATATLGMPHVAGAQAYPSRPVRMILPFGAGGVADVTSRIMADKLSQKLGQHRAPAARREYPIGHVHLLHNLCFL